MLEFTITSLSCGHCARAVTEAVHGVDPDARVDVDLGGKRVKVETSAAQDHVVAALVEAGYPPAETP
jgi:copper chaperone